MNIFDRICVVGAACSGFSIVLGTMWVVGLMIFGFDLPNPPKTIWIGLFGIMAFALLWVCVHIIAGNNPFTQ